MVKSTQIFRAKINLNPCFYFSGIVLNSVCIMKNEDDKYCPHIYLEEC